MSDDVTKNGSLNKNEYWDDYGIALTRIAVAQVCDSIGFESAQDPALENLSQIAIRYIKDFAKTACFYANLSSRTECNVVDVVQALEDLVSGKPFSGELDVDSWVRGSEACKGIHKYVSLEDVPFARDVARFPVLKSWKGGRSFLQVGEKVEGKKHIPEWLPAFPDPHTYVSTPIWNERVVDLRKDKMEQARQRRKAERSLFSLQQRLACSASESSSSTSVEQAAESDIFIAPSLLQLENGEKVKKTAECNGFLALSLQLVGNEKSPVGLRLKHSSKPLASNQNSLLEIFAPAIEKATIGPCDPIDDDGKIIPNERPIVNFHLGVTKKYLGLPLDLILQNNIVGETAQMIGRVDNKDDKKRRAEYILKQSMENSWELVQL